VKDCRVMYECMYHREGEFDAEYGAMSVEDNLDIMDSFVRVTPMPIKSGEMVFLCNCGEAYKNYACVHSGVLSMLWNLDMIFPDAERAHHLKVKQTKKVLNSFEAVAKRNKKDKISDSSAPDDPTGKVIWNPCFRPTLLLWKKAVPVWRQRVDAWNVLCLRRYCIFFLLPCKCIF
jgi:hypothetical protein